MCASRLAGKKFNTLRRSSCAAHPSARSTIRESSQMNNSLRVSRARVIPRGVVLFICSHQASSTFVVRTPAYNQGPTNISITYLITCNDSIYYLRIVRRKSGSLTFDVSIGGLRMPVLDVVRCVPVLMGIPIALVVLRVLDAASVQQMAVGVCMCVSTRHLRAFAKFTSMRQLVKQLLMVTKAASF